MDKFKGYYFKCSNEEHTLALIPASHDNKASLQIITDKGSYNVKYGRILFGRKIPRVRIGNNVFTERKIVLNINKDGIRANGILYFGCFTPLKYDIMGIFKLAAPVLQCRHRVISMRHRVNGSVEINGEKYIFKNDNGYIEGDEGRSFPNRYIWTQGFFDEGSVMLSAADVPLAGVVIKGVIAAIVVNGKEYRLATYLGAKAVRINENSAEIKQGRYRLTIQRLSDGSHELFAPERGKMKRTIRETPKCRLYCLFTKDSNIIAEFITEQGSFESELGGKIYRSISMFPVAGSSSKSPFSENLEP